MDIDTVLMVNAIQEDIIYHALIHYRKMLQEEDGKMMPTTERERIFKENMYQVNQLIHEMNRHNPIRGESVEL